MGTFTVALVFLVGASTWAAGGNTGPHGWKLSSRCRAPNGDGVVAVQNPTSEVVAASLESAGQRVGVVAEPGSTTATVPWRAGDTWSVVVGSDVVASAPIGNWWCIDTEVRTERSQWLCDGLTPIMSGYAVADNAEGIELLATPSSGGADAIGTTVRFALSPGTYATSMAPSVFTIADGGTFHFGAVVRYDAAAPDCSDPGAPQIDPNAPDAYAMFGDYWDERLAPVADTFDGAGDASSSTSIEEVTDDVAAPGAAQALHDEPARVDSAASGARSGSTLPVTGSATRLLGLAGLVAIVLGAALLSGESQLDRANRTGRT